MNTEASSVVGSPWSMIRFKIHPCLQRSFSIVAISFLDPFLKTSSVGADIVVQDWLVSYGSFLFAWIYENGLSQLF